MFQTLLVLCVCHCAHLFGEVIHQSVQRRRAVDPQRVHAWNPSNQYNHIKIIHMKRTEMYSNTLALNGRVCIDVGHSSLLQQLCIILLRWEKSGQCVCECVRSSVCCCIWYLCPLSRTQKSKFLCIPTGKYYGPSGPPACTHTRTHTYTHPVFMTPNQIKYCGNFFF